MPHKQGPKAIETERIPRENVVLKKAGVSLVVEHLPKHIQGPEFDLQHQKETKGGLWGGKMPKIVSRPANSGERPGKPSSAAVRMYTDFRLPSRSVGRLSSCCSEIVRCHTELRYGSLHKLITALLS